jgi:hypothetical protein
MMHSCALLITTWSKADLSSQPLIPVTALLKHPRSRKYIRSILAY